MPTIRLETYIDAPIEPKPVQKPHPPFVIGGSGERLTLRVVAKHADIWNFAGGTAEDFAHKSAILDEHCAAIARLDAELAARLAAEQEAAEQEAVALLQPIPGVARRTAEVLLQCSLLKIGTDLSHFPSAAHLASWAGMCPGTAESGGRRLSGRTRRGAPWVRRTLAEVASRCQPHEGDLSGGPISPHRRIAVARVARCSPSAIPCASPSLTLSHPLSHAHSPRALPRLGSRLLRRPPARPRPAMPRSPLGAARLRRHPCGSHDVLLTVFRRV
jgi:hypothetical protein